MSMRDTFEFRGAASMPMASQLQPTCARPHLLDRLSQYGEHVAMEWFLPMVNLGAAHRVGDEPHGSAGSDLGALELSGALSPVHASGGLWCRFRPCASPIPAGLWFGRGAAEVFGRVEHPIEKA